jgi:hypothetical protein
LLFAVGSNLQRGAASVVPLEGGGPIRLVLRLLRAPSWQLGSLIALAGLGFHAIALERGGVIAAQAILSTSLMVALGIEAARARRWLKLPELGGSTLLVVGVLLLLVFGKPGGGRPVDTRVQALAAVILVGVAGIGLLASRLGTARGRSAVVMGGAAGACFAMDALFLRGIAEATGNLDATPAVLDAVGFLLASAIGNIIVQRAYQRAPLRMVLPAVSAADPLTAFVVGRLLLGERLQGGAGAATAVTFGLLAMAIGIILTATGEADATTHEAMTHPGPDGTDCLRDGAHLDLD